MQVSLGVMYSLRESKERIIFGVGLSGTHFYHFIKIDSNFKGAARVWVPAASGGKPRVKRPSVGEH